MEIIVIGIGLLIGLVISWVLGLPEGDIFIWLFCLFLGLKVGKLLFSDENNDDDADLDGGILIPEFQGI